MTNHFIKLKIDGYEDELLFVRHAFMVESGISENTLLSAATRQSNSWQIVKDPADKRCNLYGFEKLSPDNKSKVKARLSDLSGGKCEDPYVYISLQPIRAAIRMDEKAEAFYLKHTYVLNGESVSLKPEKVKEYTRNASLLGMLSEFKKDKKQTKKRFGMDWLTFVEQVARVIAADGYSLPTSYRFLIMDVLKAYEAEGYTALISSKIGNQNRTKVKDLGKDMMLELLSNPNQFDDAYIRRAYNAWAKPAGYKPVSVGTVRNKRQEYGYLINSSRSGWQEFNKEFSRSVQRNPPTQPTFLWEGDDNHIDWWFTDDAGNIKRLKAYVVVDSYKGICYPLGWAFSENDITVETVRLAFLMALHHVRDLTGSWYLPNEVKTDRWSLASLQDYYEGLGHYFPTPKGSKNRGWLENFFGHADWKRSLKLNPDNLPTNNYTGHNISSKTDGANLEALQQAKVMKALPHISTAGQWISAHFERLRTIPIGWEEGAASRQELWLQGWAEMPEDKKRPATHEQILLKAGFRHIANGGNAITKEGVQPTISGAEYTYSVPPAFYLPNVGRKVQTIYSPFDMSRVLITDDERVRFMAQHITPVAGCMADMQEGGRSFLNQIIKEKAADVNRVVSEKAARRDRLAAAGQDAETALKLGPAIRKELKTAAVEEWENAEVLTLQAPAEILNSDYDIEDDATNSL